MHPCRLAHVRHDPPGRVHRDKGIAEKVGLGGDVEGFSPRQRLFGGGSVRLMSGFAPGEQGCDQCALATKPFRKIRFTTLMVSQLLLLPAIHFCLPSPRTILEDRTLTQERLSGCAARIYSPDFGRPVTCTPHSTSLRSSMSRIRASFGSSTVVCRPRNSSRTATRSRLGITRVMTARRP